MSSFSTCVQCRKLLFFSSFLLERHEYDTASLLTFIPGRPGIPCGPAGQAAGHCRRRRVQRDVSETVPSPRCCPTLKCAATTPVVKHPGNKSERTHRFPSSLTAGAGRTLEHSRATPKEDFRCPHQNPAQQRESGGQNQRVAMQTVTASGQIDQKSMQAIRRSFKH